MSGQHRARLSRTQKTIGALVVTAAASSVFAVGSGSAFAASDAGGYDAYTYTGTWAAGAPDERWSTTAGSTATATVDVAAGGSTVSIWGNTDTGGGKAAVSVDGGTPVTVDTYNSTPPPGVDANWHTTTKLAAGRHTVKINVLNQKRTAATGTAISVKGVNLPNGTIVWPGSTTPPPATGSPSTTDLSKFTSSGTWTKESALTKWYSNATGAYVTVPVTIASGGGTVTIKGTKADNYGFGAFSVDGGAETKVDLYATTRAEGTNIWTSPTLAAGQHTVKVRVDGTKRTAATGRYVAVAGASTTNGTFGTGTTTPTPTPTEPAPITAPPVAGSWTQSFAEDFTTLDPAKWQNMWYLEGGNMNNVATNARNVTTANGKLELKLESATSGALVHTDVAGGYKFPVGSYVEASVRFPGNGSKIYNWPAWWVNPTVVDGWPSSGEHDIAEGSTDGTVGVNYHSPAGGFNNGTPAGYWGDQYHRYGVHRKAASADVYWDGKLVASYPTSDNGNPEILIFNVGAWTSPAYPMYGDASKVRVDWVRAFAPSTSAPPPATGTGLDDPVVKEKALQITSTAENSTTDWTTAYKYIEDIGDGRGYTAGIVGWCSGTGDMLELIKRYNTASPNNGLTKFTDELTAIMTYPYDQRPAKSHELLDGQGFAAAWAAEAGKTAFKDAQKAERDRVYFAPALAQAKADGVGPLGLAELYDISVNHGPGTDSESFGGIVAAAQASSPPPSKGGSEVNYLKALNTKRAAVLTSWGDNQPNGRDEAFLELINAGELQLAPPVTWHMYGETFTISTNPTPR